MENIEFSDLKNSKDFLNSILDNINSAVFIADKYLNVLGFNNSFKALFNTDQKDLEEVKKCGNIMGCSYAVKANAICGSTPYCRECKLRNDLLSVFTSQVPAYKKELSRDFYIGDKFQTKELQYTVKYVDYQDDQIILIIVDDLTDIKKIQEELIALEQKNTILAMGVTANHELNQPIAVIKGYVDMIQKKLALSGDEPFTKYFNKINLSLEHAAQTIKKYSENIDYELTSYYDDINMIKFKDKEDE